VITLRAPQRSEPKPRPKPRPDLRVVETPEPLVRPATPGDAGDDLAPRTHGGLVGTLFVVLLFVCIFGVVVFQVFLVQTQSHLDDLGAQISKEENRTKALRLDTTDLEAPDRIVRDAKERLGMIPPPEIAYLQPSGADDGAAAFDPAKEAPPTTVPPATTVPTTVVPTATKTAPAAKTTPTTVKPATTATTAKPKTTTTTAAPKTTTTTAKPKTTTTTAKPKTTTTIKAAPGR